MFIGILQGAPTLAATDIVVFGDAIAPPPAGATNGDDSLVGTSGNDTIDSLGGSDTIDGAGGNDLLIGGDGNDWLYGGEQNTAEDSHDTLDGGAGDDIFDISALSGTSPNVVLIDIAGIDTVLATGAWTLAPGFENLTIDGGFSESATGVGNAQNNVLVADSTSNDFIALYGEDGNDTLIGGAGSEWLFGGAGDDWLEPGVDVAEVDEMTGGAGQDRFVFRSPPADSAFADTVADFGSSIDKLVFDNGGFTAIGGAGDFGSGDGRFYAAAGATSGHDASDRLVYDSSTGDLYYDADGSGAGEAVKVATLSGAPALQATGIGVIGAPGPAPIFGTEGNDSLVGTSGDDIIYGLGGNDTIAGRAGFDTLVGGSGGDCFVVVAPGTQLDRVSDFVSSADALIFDNALYTQIGGAGRFSPGDERFVAGASISSGQDTSDRIIYETSTGFVYYDPDGSGSQLSVLVMLLDGAPAFAAADIVVVGSAAPAPIQGTAGNDSLVGTAGNDIINGLGGNDTLVGLAGNDSMHGMEGNDMFNMSLGGTSSYGNDFIDGGAGTDVIQPVSDVRSGLTIDLAAGTLSGAGSGTLVNIESAYGGSYADRFTGDGGANALLGRGGNDTLAGAGGNDTLDGGPGNDSFVFAEAAGSANADRINGFGSGSDQLLFENGVLTALGAAGDWASGDGRFYAAAGATSGHDSSDRLIYNTTNGNLYYDADGSGAGGSLIVATLQGAPSLAATDITVI